ncbi:MAG: hypothetical protein LBG43_04570 [Treponema sp.]|nr:hypothetical protein [Treponema sp.]
MMKGKFFIPETRKTIEQIVIALLNGSQLMNYNTVNSPRAVGYAVQGFLEKNISKCLPKELVVKINTSKKVLKDNMLAIIYNFVSIVL